MYLSVHEPRREHCWNGTSPLSVLFLSSCQSITLHRHAALIASNRVAIPACLSASVRTPSIQSPPQYKRLLNYHSNDRAIQPRQLPESSTVNPFPQTSYLQQTNSLGVVIGMPAVATVSSQPAVFTTQPAISTSPPSDGNFPAASSLPSSARSIVGAASPSVSSSSAQSSPNPTSTPPPNPGGSPGTSAGLIAGAAIGSVAAIALIGIFVSLFLPHRKASSLSKQDDAPVQESRIEESPKYVAHGAAEGDADKPEMATAANA